MPFQLYPHLPAGESNQGMVKDELFADLINQRAPDMPPEQRRHRADGLIAAWQAEGLTLRSPPTGMNEHGGGRMGSSFDAQRLILLARSLGREDAMIEEVYAANHSRDECLSDWDVLLGCAKRAGVRGAEEALRSGWGMQTTLAKIDEYRRMGVTAVPVCILDSVDAIPVKAVLSSGAPELDYLHGVFTSLVQTGKLPWDPKKSGLPSPQPKLDWSPASAPATAAPVGGGGTCAKLRQLPRQQPPTQQPPSGGGGMICGGRGDAAQRELLDGKQGGQPAVRHVGSLAEFEALLRSNAADQVTTLVDFTAMWCGPCRRVGPLFEALAAELRQRMCFVKVDVDEAADVAHAERITALPAFRAYADAQVRAAWELPSPHAITTALALGMRLDPRARHALHPRIQPHPRPRPHRHNRWWMS